VLSIVKVVATEVGAQFVNDASQKALIFVLNVLSFHVEKLGRKSEHANVFYSF
jgi:hypothetical protein